MEYVHTTEYTYTIWTMVNLQYASLDVTIPSGEVVNMGPTVRQLIKQVFMQDTALLHPELQVRAR